MTSSTTTTLSTNPLTPGNLHRDRFGFQKLLVATTTGGKLFALDSSNGNIVWSRNLGLFRESGPDLQIEGMWLVRNHGDGGPVLTVLATRTSEVGAIVIAADTGTRDGSVSH
jgi:outer membrane protein assembly factor BamB